MVKTIACYSTATDIDGLIQSNAPSKRALPWTLPLATLVGVACGVAVAVQFTHPAASELSVQTKPTPALATPQRHLGRPTAPSLFQKVGNGLAALSLTTMANLGTPYIAPAAEIDVLATPTPTTEYVYDDGQLLSKAAAGELSSQLPAIEERTGYRINVVTLRKLTNSEDAFQFADNLIETWYPTAELGDKKAILVIVKNSKEGGLVGGPSFSQTVPGSVIESIINDNINKLLDQEKYNQAVQSTVSRLEAVLSGQEDPGAPKVFLAKSEVKQSATYKTKEETDSKRQVYITVFGALVAISFIAPMVQYFGYLKDDK